MPSPRTCVLVLPAVLLALAPAPAPSTTAAPLQAARDVLPASVVL